MKITFRCPAEIRAHVPAPYAAKRGIPDWFKSMPMTAFSEELGSDVATLKQCPPFVDAMAYGFIVPLPVDVTVDGTEFSWDWDIPQPSDSPDATDIGLYSQSPVGFHTPAQATGTPYFNEGIGFVKFNCFWTIELEPGYSLYVTHPANRYDLPFRTINGMVDADTYNKVFVNFPALWTDPGFSGVLRKGTPVAQCIAVRREEHVLEHLDMDREHAAQYLPLNLKIGAGDHVYRDQYRVKKP